jgi:hypothetical protein
MARTARTVARIYLNSIQAFLQAELVDVEDGCGAWADSQTARLTTSCNLSDSNLPDLPKTGKQIQHMGKERARTLSANFSTSSTFAKPANVYRCTDGAGTWRRAREPIDNKAAHTVINEDRVGIPVRVATRYWQRIDRNLVRVRVVRPHGMGHTMRR